MRMVASDLDGTLVRRDGTIAPRTVDALRACEEAGVRVLVVTGRPPRWMDQVSELLGGTGTAICGNGAAVVDLSTGEILEARSLTHDAVRGVAKALRESLPGALFALETTLGYRQEPDFLPHNGPATWRGLESRCAVPHASLEDLLTDDPVVLKVLCRLRSMRADAMLSVARGALAGVAEPVHSDPEDSLLEMSALGVSKASALSVFTAARGIAPEDVVAFGDMPNDVPMLRWAGRGYAMADGHPEAIAAADEVAPPCAQDGVAQVLERWLEGRSRG